jgi:hypothetical protein
MPTAAGRPPTLCIPRTQLTHIGTIGIDVLLSERRDTAAARRFFTRALSHGSAPVEVTTDKAAHTCVCWTNSSRPQRT